MNKDKQTKETDVVAETTEPAGLAITGSVDISDLKAQFEELETPIADAKAEALADSKALADRVVALEQPVVDTDSITQFEELKKLIADSRQFTHEVHDAIVTRLSEAEAATAALASQVAAITPIPRNYPRTKEYTVEDGDTLVMIAKVQLEQPGRMTEIRTMNYDRHPSLRTSDDIEPGWKLRLPA